LVFHDFLLKFFVSAYFVSQVFDNEIFTSDNFIIQKVGEFSTPIMVLGYPVLMILVRTPTQSITANTRIRKLPPRKTHFKEVKTPARLARISVGVG
jgi:hypothetical protein